MIELKKQYDLGKLNEELNKKRMTMEQAVAMIAQHFGVDSTDLTHPDYPYRIELHWAWDKFERQMLMDHEDATFVASYLVEAVEYGGMSPFYALQLYCDSTHKSRELLLSFAREELQCEPLRGAAEEIRRRYREGDISEIIAYLNEHEE